MLFMSEFSHVRSLPNPNFLNFSRRFPSHSSLFIWLEGGRSREWKGHFTYFGNIANNAQRWLCQGVWVMEEEGEMVKSQELEHDGRLTSPRKPWLAWDGCSTEVVFLSLWGSHTLYPLYCNISMDKIEINRKRTRNQLLLISNILIRKITFCFCYYIRLIPVF